MVDGGETVVVEGLRVSPHERGCGLAGVIQAFADGYVKKLHPRVKSKRLTRGDDPGPEKLRKFTLLARRVSSIHTNMSNIYNQVNLVLCIMNKY